ncbi:DUF3489 domain-containing protein [Aestuariivirga sp.]|uniref:DUF3489 domain-containing protein n=1 Tax=Aestuariivirga sp. TaxID=2650926 RepID=UPI00391E03D7
MTIKKSGSTSKQTKNSAPGTRSKQPAKKPPPAPLSKSQTIRALLARPQGATTSELSEATGWQVHSVRGYLSRTLKKKLGLMLDSSKDEGGRRYWLTEAVRS